MRISLPKTMTAIAAAAAVLGVVSVADARPELVMLKGVMVNGKLVSKRITPTKSLATASHSYTYTFTASVPPNTRTLLTGWALIDQSTCTEITSGRMKINGPLKVHGGRWSRGHYVESPYTCGNGGTITAVFASAFFTCTGQSEGVKKTKSTWYANGGAGFGTYKIVNHLRAVCTG